MIYEGPAHGASLHLPEDGVVRFAFSDPCASGYVRSPDRSIAPALAALRHAKVHSRSTIQAEARVSIALLSEKLVKSRPQLALLNQHTTTYRGKSERKSEGLEPSEAGHPGDRGGISAKRRICPAETPTPWARLMPLRRPVGRWRMLWLASILLSAAGCASAVPMNEPLHSAAGNTEYRLLDVNRSGGAESALVLVALSGGGKRSAAFAFGVLRGMADIPVRPEGSPSTLLDEIDLLAGVSGGSFPAAHFALNGRKSFDSFPDEFLYPDIEGYIWGTFLLPWNWEWVINPYVGTNDRMAWVYDKLMFHGATFADLYRRGRPQVSINATDISFGSPFGFLPQTFDVICSDLASLPVARAIAASNGLPVLFGPITLRNYRGAACPSPPPVSPSAWEAAQADLRQQALIENLYRYSDGELAPWVHLMDGGISDNLALRVLLNDMLTLDLRMDRFAAGLLPVRRVLIISVDGQSAPNPDWPRQRVLGGLKQTISAVTTAQISAYNIETLMAVDSTVDRLVGKLQALRCRQGPVIRGYACGDVAGKVMRVSLSDYPDPELRAQLTAIRTGLTLPREQIDALVAAGQTMIGRNAAEIAAFLKPAASSKLVSEERTP
jgi:NTE family protein